MNHVESLRVVRVLPAVPERVFNAWLDPAAIKIWMCPGDIMESIATVDACIGGEFEIVMISPGLSDRHWGKYVELDRFRRLAFTWCSAGTLQRETLVTIDLKPHGDGQCELTLIHSDLPATQVEGHRLGWRAHLKLLYNYVE